MKKLFSILALVSTISLLSACGGGEEGCQVTYEVSGSNTPQRVLMTVALPGHTTGQGTFQVWPTAHSETFHFNEGDFLYISGQNANSWNTAFEVRILVNGSLVAKSSGGGWSVVSAKATCR